MQRVLGRGGMAGRGHSRAGGTVTGGRRRYGTHGYVAVFSSRERHTRFDCDWSSDVCSSDLDGTSVRHAGTSVDARLLPRAGRKVPSIRVEGGRGKSEWGEGGGRCKPRGLGAK